MSSKTPGEGFPLNAETKTSIEATAGRRTGSDIPSKASSGKSSPPGRRPGRLDHKPAAVAFLPGGLAESINGKEQAGRLVETAGGKIDGYQVAGRVVAGPDSFTGPGNGRIYHG